MLTIKCTVKSWCDLQLRRQYIVVQSATKRSFGISIFSPSNLSEFGVKVVAYFFHKGKSLVCATTYRNNNI
jgi:hypothetical protein